MGQQPGYWFAGDVCQQGLGVEGWGIADQGQRLAEGRQPGGNIIRPNHPRLK